MGKRNFLGRQGHLVVKNRTFISEKPLLTGWVNSQSLEGNFEDCARGVANPHPELDGRDLKKGLQ